MSINDAIRHVMHLELRPLSSNEIFKKIVELKLYDFKAKNPISVVANQLRRHCVGIENMQSAKVKYYRKVEGNKFVFVDKL